MSLWDTIKSKFVSPKIVVSPEVQVLQADWVAENSDAREEGVYLDEYMRRIEAAKAAQKEDEHNPVKLLELAEVYAVVDPKDPRVLKILLRLTKFGDLFFDKMRQGDTYQLLGRSLFLAGRFEECLEVMLKAHACYRENGNRKVRRFNNVGLLRTYAALGDCKKAAERLQVALTQCEETDDSMLLYMHAKNALEKTGTARDAEILDDEWYCFLEDNPTEKKQWENYQSMGEGVLRQCNPEDERDEKNWAETLSTIWPLIKRDLQQSKFFNFLLKMLMGSLASCLFLLISQALGRSLK